MRDANPNLSDASAAAPVEASAVRLSRDLLTLASTLTVTVRLRTFCSLLVPELVQSSELLSVACVGVAEVGVLSPVSSAGGKDVLERILVKGLVGELRWHTDNAVVEIALVGALSGALSLALLIDSIDDVVKKVLVGGKVLQVT